MSPRPPATGDRSRRERPTIGDIAREAGVSTATVSRSLSGQPGVSDRTRKAIVALATDRGWRPNSAARALSRGQTGTLGWAVRQTPKTVTVDPYFLDLFVGIQLALKDTPFDLLVKLVASGPDEIRQHTEWATERRVDGIFLADVERHDPRLANLASGEITVACIADDLSSQQDVLLPADRVAQIDPGNARSVRLVLEHLMGLGHRRIAWVLGPAELAANVERRRALSQLAAGPAIAVSNTTLDPASGAEWAIREVQRHHATAVVVDNDSIAERTIHALRAAGLRVPQDVAVVAWLGPPNPPPGPVPITSLEYRVTGLGTRWAAAMMAVTYPEYEPALGPEQCRPEPPRLVPGASTDHRR